MNMAMIQNHFQHPARRQDLRSFQPRRLVFGRLAGSGALGCLLEFPDVDSASRCHAVIAKEPPFRPVTPSLCQKVSPPDRASSKSC